MLKITVQDPNKGQGAPPGVRFRSQSDGKWYDPAAGTFTLDAPPYALIALSRDAGELVGAPEGTPSTAPYADTYRVQIPTPADAWAGVGYVLVFFHHTDQPLGTWFDWTEIEVEPPASAGGRTIARVITSIAVDPC